MRVYLRESRLARKVISLEVRPYPTMRNFKFLVQDNERTFYPLQRLFLNGAELEDVHTLSDYNFHDELELELLLGHSQHILMKAIQLDNADETIESVYYPFYTALLHEWSPPEQGFGAWPQRNIPGTRMLVDFAVTGFIAGDDRPLLIVEVKPPSAFSQRSGRKGTITQILRRLDHHIDRIYAVSVIGKRWRACWVRRGGTGQGAVAVRGVAPSNRPVGMGM
ncbi:hypothetical protein V8B97DRAFT_366986 [Scleroderma yunnanense]